MCTKILSRAEQSRAEQSRAEQSRAERKAVVYSFFKATDKVKNAQAATAV